MASKDLSLVLIELQDNSPCKMVHFGSSSSFSRVLLQLFKVLCVKAILFLPVLSPCASWEMQFPRPHTPPLWLNLELTLVTWYTPNRRPESTRTVPAEPHCLTGLVLGRASWERRNVRYRFRCDSTGRSESQF
ncbi:hypothetical protein GOODEAATRI_018003 [Goodea atripinnis]|uniref:Uncharacterized protein n=1 Tax=Goodea atripinnis TaxID=208336 RepID=A0ABV0NL54_9TELE